MRYFLKTSFPVFFVVLTTAGYSQGCSDAGFCSIGALAPKQTMQEKKRQISIQLPVGIGDENVIVFTPAIQYDFRFREKWAVQAKLTANYAEGDLGSVSGPGDFYLIGTYSKGKNENGWNISASAGGKFPLSQSNLKSDGKSLPMQYQSSLGTIDLIMGIALSNPRWQFAAGWQQPLSGTNGNNFLPIYFNNDKAARYIPSNDFTRKADVLLRGLYKYRVNQRLEVRPGLLGIYHLGNDSYIDGNVSNRPIPIRGSDGLTLNASVAAWYKVSKKCSIGLTGAMPLVVRDLRPDGLTRSFVLSPEISWAF